MTEDAFLSDLHEYPSDEATWLALSDWLEENDQPLRAEMIRCVRKLRALPVMRRSKPKVKLENRVAELLRTGVRPVVAALTNSIGMRLALIEAGVFRMGSMRSEEGRDSDEVPHQVTISKHFYMGVFAVTQREYELVMGDNPSGHQPRSRKKKQDTPADLPVENVTWHEAIEFCDRLTVRERGVRPDMAYRLPREAEYEYACRGGPVSSGPYYLGGTLEKEHANFNTPRPVAVGSYPPNVFGLYDMNGNVCAWINDVLSGDMSSAPVTDPTGPEGEGGSRVYKGACYLDGPRNCRSSFRNGRTPDMRHEYLGFRVVLAPK